jgi:type I restriction enzyme, S subunit
MIPNGWEKAKLGDIADLVGGGTPSRKKPEYFTGNIVWLTPSQIPKNKITKIKDSEEKITNEGLKHSSAKILPEGAVLMTSRASIGYIAIAGTEVSTNQGFASFICDSNIYNWYLAYWLMKETPQIEQQATGTTFKEISKTKLKNFYIIFPPLSEQKRIVSKIEELFSQLDAGVAGLKQAQTGLKRYRASVLKAAFEGRLVPQDPNDEPAYEMLNRMGKYLKEQEELAKLPSGWELVKTKSVGEIITGRTPRKSHSEYYGNDFPFYKPTDLNAGFYTTSANDNLSSLGIKKARLLPEKTVLVTCIGATIGKTGIIRIPGASNQQINAIVPNDCIYPEFLYFICISPQFQKAILDNASSTTLPIINKSRFSELSFPLPPYHEQHRIAEKLDEIFSNIERLESSLDLQLKRSESIRRSILARAFNGALISQNHDNLENRIQTLKERSH